MNRNMNNPNFPWTIGAIHTTTEEVPKPGVLMDRDNWLAMTCCQYLKYTIQNALHILVTYSNFYIYFNSCYLYIEIP
jgi:hypothetical protein